MRLWSALALCLLGSMQGCASARIGGTVEGQTYTSPGKWFSVAIPTGFNPFVKEFEITDNSGREPDAGFDWAGFLIRDFGELFMAEVRSIPPSVLAQIAAETPAETLSKLANKALYDAVTNRDLAAEPQAVQDIPFQSHLGPALLRVFRLPQGSLLVMSKDGRTSRFDVLVSVIAVQQGDRFVSLFAENDYRPLEQDSLVSRTQATFASLRLVASPTASETR